MKNGFLKKKLLLVFWAASIPFAVIPQRVFAEVNDFSELNALAESLGADKDHFSFVNFSLKDYSQDIADKYASRLTSLELTTSRSEWAQYYSMSGLCYGISALEVLTHNNVITPSQIQSGAGSLSEVRLDSNVKDALYYYQSSQYFQSAMFTMKQYLSSNSIEDDCNNLIEHAEKAMKDSRYFSIAMKLKNGGHAIVCIGCADGSWEFKGRKYDKCILTLDSNTSKTDETGTKYNPGFSPDTCIYINTSEKEYYIPAYDAGSFNDKLKINCIYDNDELLNDRGLLASNPSDAYETGLTSIEIDHVLKPYSLTAYCNGEEKTFYCDEKNPLNISAYPLKSGNNIVESITDLKADCWKFTTDENESAKKEFSPAITRETDNDLQYARAGGKIDVTLRNSYVSINKKRENDIFDMWLMSNDYAKEGGTVSFQLDGTSFASSMSMEYIDGEGLLLKTDGTVNTVFTLGKITENSSGAKKYEIPELYSIIYSHDIMLRYDNETKQYMIYLDCEGDGKFDDRVQRGDTNCDGRIDARDASNILSAYADEQTGVFFGYILSKNYADYNNDGTINSIDASDVLAEYSRLSTE